MKRHRLIIVVVAVVFLLAGAAAVMAETQPAPKPTQTGPMQRAPVSVVKGNIIKGTVYISEQPDWNKAVNCNCDCIEVIVSKQTGTSGGQIKVPTYAEVAKVKATGGKVAANGKCTYSVNVPGDSLNNLSVGAKYTGKFNPQLQTGGGGIGAHPMNLVPPFSMVSGGTVVYDMKLKIDYIK